MSEEYAIGAVLAGDHVQMDFAAGTIVGREAMS
jgi:hypothetical protein